MPHRPATSVLLVPPRPLRLRQRRPRDHRHRPRPATITRRLPRTRRLAQRPHAVSDLNDKATLPQLESRRRINLPPERAQQPRELDRRRPPIKPRPDPLREPISRVRRDPHVHHEPRSPGDNVVCPISGSNGGGSIGGTTGAGRSCHRDPIRARAISSSTSRISWHASRHADRARPQRPRIHEHVLESGGITRPPVHIRAAREPTPPERRCRRCRCRPRTASRRWSGRAPPHHRA